MNAVQFEIQRGIYELEDVVKQRQVAEVKNLDRKTKRSLDLLICIRSRSVQSRFADTALWQGVNKPTIDAVRAALNSARDCLVKAKHADKKCLASVDERLTAFEKFVLEEVLRKLDLVAG
jgi:hypothetical protein